MNIRYLITLIAMAVASSMIAAPVDDGKRLYLTGDYEGAIAKLRPIVKSSPNDGTANYYLGASYYMLGNYASAIEPLKKAEKRGVADAPHLLAEIAYHDYDFDSASDYIRSWDDILRRNRKDRPDEIDQLQERILQARNMMGRVERIQIVDSLEVDAADFYKYYILPLSAGSLLDAASLPDGVESAKSVIYLPESGKEYIWSQTGDDGLHHIVTMNVLDDGTYEQPMVLDDDLGAGGDADYPFIASDGMTIYFSANGETSLGGYDIYMTRRDEDGQVMQPQNIGMPYNSPYNDYMLVIDEENNLGWWASDRYCSPGRVKIYTYRPNETRVNHSVDDPDLKSYAMLKKMDFEVNGRDIIAAIDETLYTDEDETQTFTFAINGKVYTRLEDFKNQQAAQAMSQLLQRRSELEQMERDIAMLRQRYAIGDKSVADKILQLERRIFAVPPILERLSNTIIGLER